MRMKYLSLFISSLLILAGIISCSEDKGNNPHNENQPPDTGLFLYPDSTITPQQSQLKIHWWGDDPDGIVIGYYFSWDNIDWPFTSSSDSLFALKIGAVDTNYTFRISAVDYEGNGKYDSQISQNGIDFGGEPFIDKNSNGVYDEGEFYYDIGLIDPTPAMFNFPLKNSSPTISWSELSILPETSFPVMSFGWNVDDIDGVESVLKINIALNDTGNQSNIISLDGSIRTITLRTSDFNNPSPSMQILIEGQEGNINPELLPGLILNAENIFYIQAEDISGAKSPFISLPDSTHNWYVKKPSGKFLVIDDYASSDNSPAFYAAMFDSLGLTGKYDVYDIRTQEPPYKNVTFLETIKLFDYAFWYTDNSPSLDLAASTVSKYLTAGGKVAFSMQFPQTIDAELIQSFIPIISDSSNSRVSVLSNTVIASDTTDSSYPNLIVTSSVFRVKSFYLNKLAANPIYYYPNGELKGFAGFTNSTKTEFFISLPLDKCDGNGTVKSLLQKVLFDDFGLTP